MALKTNLKGVPKIGRMKYKFKFPCKTPQRGGKIEFKQGLEFDQNSPLAPFIRIQDY